VLADIHANLQALTAVLADLDALSAGWGEAPRLVALGDMIGYGGDPGAVLDVVRARGMAAIIGNHEKGALDPACRRKCFHIHSREALERTCELLSDADRAYLAGLPASMVLDGVRFVHGMPPDDPLTYFVTRDDDELAAAFGDFPERTCFVGHSHVLEGACLSGGLLTRLELGDEPFVLEPAGRYILCCGSVGQPRDGDNRAKYVVYDRDEATAVVRRAAYDIEAAAARILEQGLPERYATRLR
jgi:diadenosine tetraphosphatase ApaH/serine/threonine PP2A family protein phosphatase